MTRDVTEVDQALDAIFQRGTPEDALMYFRLFWPAFVEVNGMVLWTGMFREDPETQVAEALRNSTTVALALRSRSIALKSVSYSVTRRPIAPMTMRRRSRRQSNRHGPRLAESFPGRRFDVRVVEADERTGEELCVIFSEDRQE